MLVLLLLLALLILLLIIIQIIIGSPGLLVGTNKTREQTKDPFYLP